MASTFPNNNNNETNMLKKLLESLKELYKESDPDERKTILKALGGALGLAGFFAFLIKL